MICKFGVIKLRNRQNDIHHNLTKRNKWNGLVLYVEDL